MFGESENLKFKEVIDNENKTIFKNLMIFIRKYEPVETLRQYIGVRAKTYSRLEVERKKDTL